MRALLLAATIATACVAERETEHASQAIIGGVADATHDAVVAIQRRSTTTLCTGTLIAKDLVLTAAHCLMGVDPSDLTIAFGPDMSTPTATIDVRATAIYPGFSGTEADRLGGLDLGVAWLVRPTDVTPIAVHAPMSAFTTATLIGYGVTNGVDSTGRGRRIAVTAPVRDSCSRMLKIGGAEANACTGDSGGPVLVDDQLVAVVSGGLAGCGAPSDHTRLDAHRAWLARALAGTLERCPECVSADSSCTAPVEEVEDQAEAGGGGCAVRRGREVHLPWLALALLAVRRRKGGSPRD